MIDKLEKLTESLFNVMQAKDIVISSLDLHIDFKRGMIKNIMKRENIKNYEDGKGNLWMLNRRDEIRLLPIENRHYIKYGTPKDANSST